MCGFYGHGFYWEGEQQELEKEPVVVFDFEINSHSKIKEYRKIPSHAKRCGFSPINGEPVSNEKEELPQKVREKINLMFQMYFPNKEAIAAWIRKNYNKNGDTEEWNRELPKILDDFGRRLFPKKYYQRVIGYYQREIEHCQRAIGDYQRWIYHFQQEIGYYQRWIEYYQQEIEYYQREIENYQREIENYQQEIEDCTGTLDEMDIEKFIAYFLKHPNNYWADKIQERKVKYESFVKV